MTKLLLLGVLAGGVMIGIAVGQDRGPEKDRSHEKDSVTVPEPSQAIPALALLAGSTLILRARRKK